ncbi:MAG TPA: hypothetical protein VGE39_09935 [Prosthecobacter sp.]
MNDSPDIGKLIDELDAMPHSAAQAEAARMLWSHAQQHPDPALRFRALASTLQAVVFSGDSAYFLSLFPQLVRLKQEHPDAVDTHTYVWRIKWLVGHMDDFPEVPWQRITEAEDFYARTLQEVGGNQRTAIYMRWKNALFAGKMEKLAALREEFLALPRDSHADCHACEVNALVRHALHSGDFNRAKEAAEPLVTRRMRCAEVPHSTFGNLLLPTLLEGDADTAAQYHRKGYPLVRFNVGLLGIVGDHLGYLAAVGAEDMFLRLLKNHSAWLEQNHNPADHLDFFTAAAAGLEMLAESGRRKRPLKLNLPPKLHEAWGESLPVAALGEHFANEARQLASAFDRRNGNTWKKDRAEQMWADIRELRKKHAGTVSALS